MLNGIDLDTESCYTDTKVRVCSTFGCSVHLRGTATLLREANLYNESLSLKWSNLKGMSSLLFDENFYLLE